MQGHHDDGQLTIVSDEGTFEIDSTKLHPYHVSHSEYCDDIAVMNNLHEAPLLDLLRRRFQADDIYVSCAKDGRVQQIGVQLRKGRQANGKRKERAPSCVTRACQNSQIRPSLMRARHGTALDLACLT